MNMSSHNANDNTHDGGASSPAPHSDAVPRSCHALGACQDHGPGCYGSCRYINGLDVGSAQQRKPRLRWPRISAFGRLVLQAMAIVVFASAMGHLAGLAQAQGWLQ